MPCPDFATWLAAQPQPAHPESAYHYAAEGFSKLKPLLEDYPGVVRVECFGESSQGQPLWAVHIHNPSLPSRGSMLVIANIHAMEWVPSEIAFAWIQAVVPLAPAIDLTVVPVLNPDGRMRVERDLLEGKNRYHRGNASRVDLNRDFSVFRDTDSIWPAFIPAYYRKTPGPLSQPETQALDQLAQRPYDVALSLHSFGGFFYYPWTGRWQRAEDWREFHRLGRVMQASMGAHAYRPRQLSRWAFFFRAQGSEIDHLYGKYGTIAFLVETTRSGIERLEDVRTYFRWYNPRDPMRHIREGLRYLRAISQEIVEGRAQRLPPPAAAKPTP